MKHDQLLPGMARASPAGTVAASEALDKGTNFPDIGSEHAMFNCGSDR